MQVARNKVITLSYELSESGKSVLENGNLDYLHGFKNIMPTLEKFLADKREGFAGKVEMSPRDAFGELDAKLVMKVPKSDMADADQLEVGMQIELESEEGVMPAFVKSIADDHFIADANHPYAGKKVIFSVKIEKIRDATAEELSHGHAHGGHGHHH